MSSPESASFFGKRKTLHIVLAIVTLGFGCSSWLAIYFWRKGNKVLAIVTGSVLGLFVLLIGVGCDQRGGVSGS